MRRTLITASDPVRSSPIEQSFGQRGLQAQGQELVVGHDQVVMLRFATRVGQVGDIGPSGVGDQLDPTSRSRTPPSCPDAPAPQIPAPSLMATGERVPRY